MSRRTMAPRPSFGGLSQRGSPEISGPLPEGNQADQGVPTCRVRVTANGAAYLHSKPHASTNRLPNPVSCTSRSI